MTENNKRLVVVEPTSSNPELLEALYDAAIPTIVLTPFKNDVENIRSKLVDTEILLIRSYDVNDWISSLPSNEKILGVIPGNELAVERTARLAEALDKGNYSNYDTAVVCRYKDKMRICLEKAGIPIPRFEIITSMDQAEEAAERVGYPCVVKPTDQAGSYGVRLVKSRMELHEALDFIYNRRLYEDAYGFDNPTMPKRKQVLIEEALTGQEFSLEMFFVNGEILFEATTEKETTKAPHFIEISHSVPPLKYSHLQNDLLLFGRKVAAALGITDGISHCEVMLTDGGFKVIECANRIPGDQILTLHRNSYGVNIGKAVILHAINEPVKISPILSKSTVIKYLYFNQAGVIEDVLFNDDELECMPGMIKTSINLHKGQEIRPLNTIFDRYGYVMCQGATPEEAGRNCDSALNIIKSKIIII